MGCVFSERNCCAEEIPIDDNLLNKPDIIQNIDQSRAI
jgi:hypothetical protein